MRTRTKVKKDATTPANPVYRLTDMIVEEVSAVDRAANKRTFLLVKNADGVASSGSEVVVGANGELTVSKAPEPPTAAAPAASVAPASEAAPTSPDAPQIPSATNTVEAPNGTVINLSPETKADLVARIAEATKQLAKLSATVNGAAEVQGSAEIPQEVVDGVAGIVSALDSGVTKAAVEKGRKQISMARETKIRAAHSALAEIVAELDAPAATATEASVEAPAAPAPTAPAVPATKSIDKRDLVIAGLVGVVEKATASLAKQEARIAQIERTRPTSNAGTVESSAPMRTTKSDTTPVWPADMNSGGRDDASVDGDFTSR